MIAKEASKCYSCSTVPRLLYNRRSGLFSLECLCRGAAAKTYNAVLEVWEESNSKNEKVVPN